MASTCGPMMNDKDYQAQSDHRTMMDASEIQQSPSRMAGVKKTQSKQEKKLAIMRKSMGGNRNMTGGSR